MTDHDSGARQAMIETKENVAHLDWRTFADPRPDTPPEHIKIFDEYFSGFVAIPIKDEDGKKTFQTQFCVGCDQPLTGFVALVGRGGFRWGIAHGHGNCAGCGWPCIAHHFIKDADGNDVLTLHNFILQVHPDFVERREKGVGA